MKNKMQMPAVVLALALSLATIAGQEYGQKRDPTTGQPIPMMSAFDPTTGQPITPQPPQWIDPNWKDPDKVLTNIAYDNMPLSMIAQGLRDQFKEQFDIILPNDSVAVKIVDGESVSVPNIAIQLRLKDVRASELFNAMNLVFENERTPLRWDLQVVGHRQIALLRVLEPTAPSSPTPPPAPPEPVRRIFFVGDLIGDEKSGGMSMEKIIQTVLDIWQMADNTNGHIQFHKDAQLLVVSGTPSQVDFVQETLSALRDRQRHAMEKAKSEDSKASSATKR